MLMAASAALLPRWFRLDEGRYPKDWDAWDGADPRGTSDPRKLEAAGCSHWLRLSTCSGEWMLKYPQHGHGLHTR